VFLDDERCYVVLFACAMKDTTISLKIERALKTKLLVLARNENRTLSNFIEKLLKEEVSRHEGKSGRIKAE
jgi:predicted transcriptional regulator